MVTVSYNIKNLRDELDQLREDNAPGNVDYDYVDLCFNITQANCNTIYAKLITALADLPRIDTATFHIYASLWLIRPYSLDVEVVAEAEIASPYVWQYDDLDEGKYELRIRIETDLTGPSATVEKEYNTTVVLNCCEYKKETLISTIREKIASLGCTIKTFGYIGRNTFKHFNYLTELEVYLWVLNKSCCCNCETVDSIKCRVDKIITECNC